MKLELNKKNKSLLAVWIIAALVYILAFAVIPFPKTYSFVWIVFLFTLISFAISFFAICKTVDGGDTAVSKFYGYPIYQISIIYVLAQVVLSIVICGVSIFTKIAYWIALLPSVAILGLALIGLIAADKAKDIIEQADTNLKTETKNVGLFSIDVATIMDLCDDAEMKKEIEKLAEEIRYSDPVSSDATKNIENSISKEISELREMAEHSEFEKKKIIQISNLLRERNRICKMSK